MKILKILIALLLIPYSVWAACTGSSPTWTTDGNESADLQECIDEATCVTGDTINIIAGDGEADWAGGAVSIPDDQALNIIGPGVSNLTINITGNYVITNLGAASRISGLYFKSAVNESKYTALSMKGQGWRVDNCKYEAIVNVDTSGTAFFIFANDTNVAVGPTTGLIDNNTIIDGKVGVNGGSNWAEYSAIWATAAGLGDGSAVYIEDNIYTTTTDGAALAVDSNWAGSYVFRYNTLTDYNTLAHGTQAYEERGTRRWEVYGNSFALTQGSFYMIDVKAGEGVAFNNKEINAGAAYTQVVYLLHERSYKEYGAWGGCDGDSVADEDDVGEGTGWLCRDQIGAGVDASSWANAANEGPAQTKSPAYFWNNQQHAGTVKAAYVHTESQTHITENRDYYEDDTTNCTAGGADCTAGVGCGTFANRPGDCTTGVAYWATNQSCADLSSLVGADPTTPIDGTLYQCSSTDTWTAHFTPYTYPHPLQGLGTCVVTGTITPSATEGEMVAGSKTAIVTLTSAEFTTDVGDDHQDTEDFLDGFDSNKSEAAGWNVEVRDALADLADNGTDEVTRDSATQCTVVFPAFASFDISESETVTVTIPASALISDDPIICTETFQIISETGPAYPEIGMMGVSIQ